MKQSKTDRRTIHAGSTLAWAMCMFSILAAAVAVPARPLKTKAAPAASATAPAAAEEAAGESGAEGRGYTIEKPGTITFTVGVKIKGKVEKPQVMIFLPKERPQYRDVTFRHTFKNDLMEPLPFKPNLP